MPRHTTKTNVPYGFDSYVTDQRNRLSGAARMIVRGQKGVCNWRISTPSTPTAVRGVNALQEGSNLYQRRVILFSSQMCVFLGDRL